MCEEWINRSIVTKNRELKIKHLLKTYKLYHYFMLLSNTAENGTNLCLWFMMLRAGIEIKSSCI